MSDFDSLWSSAVRFRRVSRPLRTLIQALHDDLRKSPPDLIRLKSDLERLLAFLASDQGRTDANCCTVDRFFSAANFDVSPLPPNLRAILADLGGTLHDTVYAPHIASTFESLPEQLLARVRQIDVA